MEDNRPIVIEQVNGHDREYDIYSRLLKERIIFYDEGVSTRSASAVIAQLLFLQMEDPNEDITMYINSPGGSVSDGLAIVDTMRYISCDIKTVVIGMAASMGSLIASSGTKGKRYILPHSKFLIHQVRKQGMGYSPIVNPDLQVEAKEMEKNNNTLIKILSENTGQSIEKLKKDMDRDCWLDAKESVKYGLCDEIITKIEL